jgi:protein-S-isoprenylcysteine O-methyltransferase Ste14
MKPSADRARIIAPPPLIGLACIGLAFLGRHFVPLPLSEQPNVGQFVFGWVMIAVAIGAIVFARRSFIAHGTHPNPYRPTKALVDTGPFRLSRNPIYVAFLVFVLAFVVLANSLWFVVAAFVLFVVLHFGVVRREEDYLRARFGPAYESYCGRVRRWI